MNSDGLTQEERHQISAQKSSFDGGEGDESKSALSQQDSKSSQENDDGVDPLAKYLNGIIEEHSSQDDRKYVFDVFSSFADGSGGSDFTTDKEIHGVGTVSQKKA